MPHPTAPLIQILNGKHNNKDIHGAIATIVDVYDPEFGYYILNGPCTGSTVIPDGSGDEIAAWRECAAVPTSELAALRDAFMGVELSDFQHAVMRKLFTHLPKGHPMNPNDPLVQKITFGEPGDDN